MPPKKNRPKRFVTLLAAMAALTTCNMALNAGKAIAAPSDDFVYTVMGSTTQLPFVGAGYGTNYMVTYTDDAGTHTVPGDHGAIIDFPNSGPYDIHEIRVSGDMESISAGGLGQTNITDIKQWGSTPWRSLENAFGGVDTFRGYSATDTPNLSQSPSLRRMFSYSNFNGAIENWDTSKVMTTEAMFEGARSFNQPLNGWDVSSVINMSSMFESATAFNQPLNSWNTSSVATMASMFDDAKNFNQPLNDWNTSNVATMAGMFAGAQAFNQPLDKWNTSKVDSLNYMFLQATSFDQPLNSWDTSNVVTAIGTFSGATSFNKPLNNWNTANFTETSQMFSGASSFNQPLNDWNTSKVTAMPLMFAGAVKFNQPLDKWNTSDVSHMCSVFTDASSFDQSLASWNVASVDSMCQMLSGSGMSTANYDATLAAWSTQPVKANVELGADGLVYSSSRDARQSLITNHTWDIHGDSFASAKLQITKIHQATGTKLAGAEYDIADTNGKVVAHLTTDGNGTATTPELPLGDYTITETKAPAGYAPDTTPIKVTLSTRDQILPKTFDAVPAAGKIEVTKIDQATGAKLAGAEYDIADTNGKVVAHLTTDGNGTATTPELPIGDYTITETKAPAGYAPDTTPIKVTLNANGQTIQKTLNGTKLAETPDPTQPKGQELDSTQPRGKETARPLPGTGSAIGATSFALLALGSATALTLTRHRRRMINN